MHIYEKRTYSIKVGQMENISDLYAKEGYPILEAAGLADNLIGYFISDTGRLHQLIHIWKFENDAERRKFWAKVYANEEFMEVAGRIRALIETQEVQLLRSASWGPQP